MRLSIIKGRVFACTLSLVMIIGATSPFITATTSAATSVKLGQACNDERGKVKGGKSGDQTGKEVLITKYGYSSKKGNAYNWKYVFRLNNPETAKKLAEKMKETCLNNHVGYDQQQPDRFSFYNEAKKVNWDIKRIKNNCETTCTSAISVCLNAVGIPIRRFFTVNHVYNDLKNTGKFTIITAKDFTTKPDYLEPGDILLSSCHAAMVVESPNSNGVTIKNLSSPGSTNYAKGKKYQVMTQLNVRSGPGKKYNILKFSDLSVSDKKYCLSSKSAVLNIGAVVTCKGVSGDWIKTDSGWICGNNQDGVYILEYTGTSAQKNLLSKAKTGVYEKTLNTKEKSSTTKKTNTGKKTTTNKSTQKAFKANKNYKLAKDLYVRSGPGTKYRILKRSQLSKDGKKHAKNSTKAVLKKGTTVTCLETKGSWMKIPSGWISCGNGNVK